MIEFFFLTAVVLCPLVVVLIVLPELDRRQAAERVWRENLRRLKRTFEK